jgi:hypothetical protein
MLLVYTYQEAIHMKVSQLQEAARSSLWIAALYATVSSSFMVEQIGLPQLDTRSSEAWNGESPGARLDRFRERLGNTDTHLDISKEVDEGKM